MASAHHVREQRRSQQGLALTLGWRKSSRRAPPRSRHFVRHLLCGLDCATLVLGLVGRFLSLVFVLFFIELRLPTLRRADGDPTKEIEGKMSDR